VFQNYIKRGNSTSNLKPERIIVFSRSFQSQKKSVIIYVLILPKSTQGTQRNLW